MLADAGVVVARDGALLGPLRVREAGEADVLALADLAATTFPLACPDPTTLADVRRHVAAHLSPAHWREHLADPDHHVLLLVDRSGLAVGYSLLLTGEAQGSDLAGTGIAVEGTRYAELSKLYLLARCHGTGAAGVLMAATLERAATLADAVWLGTNAGNAAARRSYERSGFAVVGERTFRVGDVDHLDVVMLRSVAD
nr:GNAT family N-acetyltransferase [Serinibacter arcticus]